MGNILCLEELMSTKTNATVIQDSIITKPIEPPSIQIMKGRRNVCSDIKSWEEAWTIVSDEEFTVIMSKER